MGTEQKLTDDGVLEEMAWNVVESFEAYDEKKGAKLHVQNWVALLRQCLEAHEEVEEHRNDWTS